MTALWLRVDQELEGDTLQQAVYGELKGPGIRRARTLMLPAGPEYPGAAWHKTRVKGGGDYFVYATLPSGRQVSERIAVPARSDKPVKLVIAQPRSGHEHLSWPQFLGAAQRDFSAMAMESRIEGGRKAHLSENPIDRVLGGGSPRIDLIGLGADGGARASVPVDWGQQVLVSMPQGRGRYQEDFCFQVQIQRDEENLLIGLRPAPEGGGERRLAGPVFLRLHLGELPPVIAALPVPWMPSRDAGGSLAGVQVVVHAEPENPRPDITVIVRDGLMGPLLGYLENSQVGIVDTMMEQFLPAAEQMLYEKRQNPYGAAAGGLILLRFQAWDRLHQWPYNLASWFPTLPDGAVIAGWCGLAGKKPPPEARELFNGAAPRDLFLAAAARGVPMFTHALHLLVDGLKRCQTGSQDDTEVAEALHTMRRYALASAADHTFTTFYGQSLETPVVLPD